MTDWLTDCLSVCLSVYLTDCLCVCVCVCLSVCLYVCLSVCMSVCMSVCLSVCLSVFFFKWWGDKLSFSIILYMSIYLSYSVTDNKENMPLDFVLYLFFIYLFFYFYFYFYFHFFSYFFRCEGWCCPFGSNKNNQREITVYNNNSKWKCEELWRLYW